MEELLVVVEKLTTNEILESKLVEQCYRRFSECRFIKKNEETYLLEYVLPQLYALYERNILQKSFVYLSLIAGGNIDILRKFVEYDKNVFKLNIRDSASLYDYTLYTRQHWFEKVLYNFDECKDIFSVNVLDKVLLLKLIYLTNNKTTNVERIKEVLNNIHTDGLEEFWGLYVWEVRRSIDLSEFCKKKSSNSDRVNIFLHSRNHCILETLSEHLDFSSVDRNEIMLAIREDEGFYKSGNVQSEIFASFSLMADILNILRPLNNIFNVNEAMQVIRTNLLSVGNKKLQIELLENIFVLLFLKPGHFLNDKPSELYVCTEKEIRIILFLLKDILQEIKLKNLYDKDSPEYKRFLDLNKYVTDAMWRMELTTNVKAPEKCEKKLLKYMMASPESLIQMCLKQGDFERAYQVIKIFELSESPISYEIEYTEKLGDLRDTLKKISKIREIQKQNPNMPVLKNEVQLEKTIEDFFKTNKVIVNQEDEDALERKCEQNICLTHHKLKNETFMNMFDLSLTQPRNFEDCEVMLRLASEHNTLEPSITSNYSTFARKALEIFREFGITNKLTLSEILLDPSYDLNISKYKKEEEFYSNLAELYDEFYKHLNLEEVGILNANHSSHKTLIKINKLCNEFVEWNLNITDNARYLFRLYNYLKSFSKIFYIEQNTSDIVSKGKNTSFFELLNRNRSELTGKLLFEKNLDPSEFEKYFGKMKLDYLYHVVGNCFPTINLHTQEKVTEEELYPENNLFAPSQGIITYIQKRNWLLAFILNEMYKVEGVKIDVSRDRIKTFLNYMALPKIKYLGSLFKGNLIITALQNEISYQKVSTYVNMQILKQEMTSSHNSHSSGSFEAAEEIQEDAIRSTNWTVLFELLESIPEMQMKKQPEFVNLRDQILANLVQDGFEFECYKFVRYISHRDLRVNIILENLKKWPGDFCANIIKAECTKFDLIHDSKIIEMKMWLQHIELCEELTKIMDSSHWSVTYDLCVNNPEKVILKLLDSENVNLLIEYINLHHANEDLLLKINKTHILKIFQSNTTLETIDNLLEHLPRDHSLNICYNLLKSLQKLEQLQFVVDYILKNAIDDSLRNVEISLKMLKFFASNEQEQLLCLLYEPLNIIEILLMNTKFDKLTLCLEVLQKEVANVEYNENAVCIEKVNGLLRKYAEKCLDFRVITQPNPRLLRTPECKLMQSLDSLNLDPKGFTMPENVPDKEDWVQNNEVLECMCCQKITFSMFNRRHHCRRCGRVICYNCSMKRMLVPTYEDLLVRVCDDCHNQTFGSAHSSDASVKSLIYDYWLLTDDPDHNHVVREEFSYEHAPSVSLCLNIMRFHSKDEEYARFLLRQCEVMLKLLQPSQEPLQEIDYLLVIKMLKSLAVAAKMSSLECTLQYGTSLADRVLSQAELLGLLAERGCLSLLPISGHSPGSYIDASVLRRLRDKLLEKEQWNLALEVSTKAGLDNTGVFAAWGKSSLKAGSLLVARDKFQRCFEGKSHYYESFSDTISEIDETSGPMKRLRNISETSRPLRNPPLLNEIVLILESKTEIISNEVLKQVEAQKMSSSTLTLNQGFASSFQPDAAICILNKLRNLKSISAGNYMVEKPARRPNSSKPPIDSIFYEECVYYLSRYGTHLSLITFFIKHGQMEKALNYIILNKLSTEVFVEIYMKCLKEGIINFLQECMSKIDCTLDVWKDYLTQICCHLEKQNMLNSLYQLQQYMGDFIRAAMTCIRFYEENITNFTDLRNNSHFLQKAEEHLKQVLEQDQWVEVASVKSSGTKDSFEEKGITNPLLVMRMSSKEIDGHVSTLELQSEVTKFLAGCEENDVKPMRILLGMTPSEEPATKRPTIPTLFGTSTDKKNLAVLTIISGTNVEDGFDICLKIIRTCQLKPVKVYNEAGKQLAKSERYGGIVQLVNCIKKSGTNDAVVKDMCDQMLTLAVATFTKANVSGTKVEDLIKLISDRATKISAYIEAKQLKTAYFLAVKYKRMSDIRRILRESELLNQPSIKALCLKVLQSHSQSPVYSKEKEIKE